MLCRVADSLFWMSRYLERAENTARIVDVNLQMLLELEGLEPEQQKTHWEPILASLGELAVFHSLYDEANGHTVPEFLTFNRKNSSSLISCVFAARENARMIRDQISSDMWESINRLYLSLKSTDIEAVWNHGPSEFYYQIKETIHSFQGLTDATYPQTEGYHFINAGKFLERADKTGRILDIKYHLLLPDVEQVGGGVDTAQWVSLLKGASALEAYHRIYVTNILPASVAEFLILSPSFPRSIRFCLEHLAQALHSISGCPRTHYDNEAERILGKLLSELQYTSAEEIISNGLHQFLGRSEETINNIGIELANRYMFFPIEDPALDAETQSNA